MRESVLECTYVSEKVVTIRENHLPYRSRHVVSRRGSSDRKSVGHRPKARSADNLSISRVSRGDPHAKSAVRVASAARSGTARPIPKSPER